MNWKVTALSPLLIGDGRALSPIDYMVWKDQVNVLDQGRIFKLLARGPRLDSYLAQLKKATKLDFASWGGFAQNFSQRRIAFESEGLTSLWNAAPSENLFIPTFAADHRGAYLPGSAVKGGLRTGLVFSRWTEATVERLAASMEGDRLPRRAGESAELPAGASQVRVVAMADSQPVDRTAFNVFLSRVANMDTRAGAKPGLAWKIAGRGSVAPPRINESTATFIEMAVPGTTFHGRWEERSFFEDTDIARQLGWRSAPHPAQLLRAANSYAKAQLEIHQHWAETAQLQLLAQSLLKLKMQVQEFESSPSSCLLCLGWGSGFLSKAAFQDTNNVHYRKLLRAVPSFGRSVRDGIPFPKTRRVLFRNGQPAELPGWVRLDLQAA